MTLKDRLDAMEDFCVELQNEILRLEDKVSELEYKYEEDMIEVIEEEDKMIRTSLCDVYGDCEACPEFDVCFDAIVPEEEREEDECPVDCDEDCDECREMVEVESYMDALRFRGL